MQTASARKGVVVMAERKCELLGKRANRACMTVSFSHRRYDPCRSCHILILVFMITLFCLQNMVIVSKIATILSEIDTHDGVV